MKSLKKYAIISLASFVILVLAGCQKSEENSPTKIQPTPQEELSTPVDNVQSDNNPMQADPMQDVQPVEGTDEVSKTINEIDELLNETDVDDLSGEIEIEEEELYS
ncbi:MAG: hypothetical protein PHQ20_03850, partial [Candidatus Moranbacteria bacterium]|nr:hypothetical protein [Candidatus Moranbacteria bacterium]